MPKTVKTNYDLSLIKVNEVYQRRKSSNESWRKALLKKRLMDSHQGLCFLFTRLLETFHISLVWESVEKMSYMLTFSDSSCARWFSELWAYYKYLRETVDTKITLTNWVNISAIDYYLCGGRKSMKRITGPRWTLDHA